tara:strand:- start:294 stop:731 length:438 start_codon:yes stop_codon:yes gene_type:complete
LFYSLVWLRPDLIKGGVRDVIRVGVAARSLELLVLSWVLYGYDISWNFLGIKMTFIIAGQILNLAVYDQLGLEGVYYGSQFRDLPIIKSFPYTVCSNPQYVGCILTYYGILLFYPCQEVLMISLYGILWYMATTEIEKIPKIKMS